MPEESQPHNCVAELDVLCYPRPDLKQEPLSDEELSGYAVVTPSGVLEAAPLPQLSAQACELIALTHVCVLSKDQKVTILHHKFIFDILDTVILPSSVAIIKCATTPLAAKSSNTT